MKTPEITDRVLERYEVMQSPVGRWRLLAGVRLRRWIWLWLQTSGGAVKRAFDIVVSTIMLILLAPLFLLIALLIKLEDGGPIIFSQTRVGRFGREFKMYKFRSMAVNAEQRLKDLLAANQHAQGVTFKMKNDPRVTRVGRLLRKSSMDELPQIFNVFLGNMSFVGPRPPLPREVERYTLADRRRLFVKPGITCLWQIGGRANIDFSGQVDLDVRYIESQSFWVDVRIMAKTVPAVVSGNGAC